MIWRPKPGDRVEIRYGVQWRKGRRFELLHESRGIVKEAGRGPGPINALVELDLGGYPPLVVVPRGNLVAVIREG